MLVLALNWNAKHSTEPMAVTCKLASIPWLQCWYTYLPLLLPEAFLFGSFGKGVRYPVGWGRGCNFWSEKAETGGPERCCCCFCWKRPLDFCPSRAFASFNCLDRAPLSITAMRSFSPIRADFSHLRTTLPNEAELSLRWSLAFSRSLTNSPYEGITLSWFRENCNCSRSRTDFFIYLTVSLSSLSTARDHALNKGPKINWAFLGSL